MNINQPHQGVGLALPFTAAADPEQREAEPELRIPFLKRVPDSIRNHFVAMSGEYVGTVLFLFFALSGTQVANNIPSSSGLSVSETGSNPQQLLYIALCFGFSLAVNAWVFFRITGGLFNPAVTFGMCLIGALPWFRGSLLFFVQILGGITAAALVSCMFPGDLTVQTTLGGRTTVVQGLFIEMLLTAELVFTIFMLAAEKHKGTFIAPIGIGLALFVAELTGVYFTGGSLNPARSFGPAVLNASAGSGTNEGGNVGFHNYHWIYWVGPLLGAIVAAGFYKFIKILEYETVNPNQDAAEKAAEKRAEARAEAHAEARAQGNGDLEHGTTSAGLVNSHDKVDLGLHDGVGMNGMNGMNGRPSVGRAASSRQNLSSPAMGRTDDAFHGLASGMHGVDPIDPKIQ